MTDREKRVVSAFIKAYKDRDWTYSYIVLALEDDERFGWMSDAAKKEIYDNIQDV